MSFKIPAFILATVMLLFPAANSRGADSSPGNSQPPRELTVKVVDARGEPVPGATVELFGVGRFSHHPPDWQEVNPKPPAVDGIWVFKTDKKGECTVQFWKEKLPGADTPEDWDVPGYGQYYFLVTKTGFAGGVSLRVDHFAPGEKSDRDDDEWKNARRPSINLDGLKSGHPLTIALSRGIAVTGHVEDIHGKALGGKTIEIFYDLHVESHTGYGGEFWPQKATTDAAGDFRFDVLYPARIHLVVQAHWARTRIDKQWVDGPVDYLDPAQGRDLHLTLVYAANPLHRYSGRIVDESGNPIPSLLLHIGLSRHWPPADYSDEHHSESATTDANGHYELDTDSPFVRYVLPASPSPYKGVDVDDSKPVKSFDFKFSKSP